MGRPRLPNNKKAYKGLSRRLAGYMLQVRNIYDRLNEKVASLVESVGYDGSTEFFFADFPEVKRDLLLLQRQFVGEMQTLIYSGTSVEWKNSNIFQDLVANKALKYYRVQVSGEHFKHYFDSNSDQLKAFQARKDKGLNLSTKLWKQADIYKESLEATISTAIEKGMSATTLSKRISRYLKDWPSLQADYQERYAKATHCHDCEYNSIRLARNEISMAYRTAEQLRWQKFDFILGYKIKLSDSHPKYDICDELMGDYPKDFRFAGWHPNCLCYTVPIVMSEEEYWSDNREDSPNKITDPPENFSKWVADNSKRVNDAIERKTLPYWVRDNNIDKAVLLLGENKDLYNSANWGLLSRSLNESNIDSVIRTNKKLNKLLDSRIPPISHTNQMVVPVNGSDFKAVISTEKIRNKRGWMVDVHDDYSGMKCFLTSDGKSGIAVTKDGDIISVFSSVSGDKRLEKLIPIAIENGGIKCDCYGGGLQDIYARYGAKATGKIPFNKEYAPSDWDGKSEYPVVAMKFPESIDKSIKYYNRNVFIDMKKVKAFDDYEKMLLDRDKRIKLYHYSNKKM
jgi:hypothetical protein|nr:MAG TPA: minor capsid protein [Caudoviricetes sp.]